MRAKKLVTAAVAATAVVAVTGSAVGYAETTDTTARKITGTLSDGFTYLFEVPANWNGTVLLYSHGYNAGPLIRTAVTVATTRSCESRTLV
jgi:hypothetical protein